jgi:hypothetical protein
MFFKRKKTKQENFLDELYWDSTILKEMIASYKKDRKVLLDLLRDRVRHTKPYFRSNYYCSTVEFAGLSIGLTRPYTANYDGHELSTSIAEDLYKLYRMVWCNDTEVRL